MPNTNFGTNMPSAFAPMPRTYNNVVFDASTGLMVATSTVMNDFNVYDEDGNPIWEPDGTQLLFPVNIVGI